MDAIVHDPSVEIVLRIVMVPPPSYGMRLSESEAFAIVVDALRPVGLVRAETIPEQKRLPPGRVNASRPRDRRLGVCPRGTHCVPCPLDRWSVVPTLPVRRGCAPGRYSRFHVPPFSPFSPRPLLLVHDSFRDPPPGRSSGA